MLDPTSTSITPATESTPIGDPPRLALRPKAAAKALGIGQRKLWELTNRGLIPHVRIDNCVLYPLEARRAWLAEQTRGARR